MPVHSVFKSDDSEVYSSIQGWINDDNQLYIQISTTDDIGEIPSFVVLNKRTAIKFVKEMRKEISFLEEEEDND